MPTPPRSDVTGINLDKNYESPRTLICGMFPSLVCSSIVQISPAASVMPVISTWHINVDDTLLPILPDPSFIGIYCGTSKVRRRVRESVFNQDGSGIRIFVVGARGKHKNVSSTPLSSYSIN